MLLLVIGFLVGMAGIIAQFTDKLAMLSPYTLYMFIIAWVLATVGWIMKE